MINLYNVDMIFQDMNALAFILDWLLPSCQDSGDKDCSSLSRVLISTLAACNHSPDAQACLVQEIKLALTRAMTLAESAEKHARLQALTSIVSSIIEACPVPGHIPSSVFKGQGPMNNIVKILLKKGIVQDLAKITHSLDLSSPNMATTVNGALKPLETLSRIVNQPQTVVSKGKGNKGTGAEQSSTEPLVTEASEQQNNENTQRKHAGIVLHNL